jgi:GNAT superfamily N-acetyltransferase
MEADAGEIAALWRTHYRGDDWTWVGGPEAIAPYLRDKRVVGLGLRTGGGLVATIFAVPLGEETRVGSTVIRDYGFHVVEGLVVHGDLRGQGVAGWMIAAIDGTVSRLYAPRPFACLWSRELSTKPAFPTVVSCRPYSWKACTGVPVPEGWRLVSTAEFPLEGAWTSRVAAATDAIATTSIDARRGGLLCAVSSSDAVVVSDTCRATRDGTRIYEVVWASSFAAVEAATSFVSGLLFTTVDTTGRDGWATGTSGYHAYSIYNYWPPSFGSCEILALREEL